MSASKKELWSIDKQSLPLDVPVSNDIAEIWYRLPSIRVRFDYEPLKEYNIRLHRSVTMDAVWTLSEASTGLRLHGDIPHEFYIGDPDALLAEFCAGRMLRITADSMRDAVAAGNARLANFTARLGAPSQSGGDASAGEKARE